MRSRPCTVTQRNLAGPESSGGCYGLSFRWPWSTLKSPKPGTPGTPPGGATLTDRRLGQDCAAVGHGGCSEGDVLLQHDGPDFAVGCGGFGFDVCSVGFDFFFGLG